MALKVKRPTVIVVLVEEQRAVLFTVMECGSNSGSGSLMSFIINIDDFHGRAVVVIKLDPISLTCTSVMDIANNCKSKFYAVHLEQNIDEGSFY
jgi:hypothetical protein